MLKIKTVDGNYDVNIINTDKFNYNKIYLNSIVNYYQNNNYIVYKIIVFSTAFIFSVVKNNCYNTIVFHYDYIYEIDKYLYVCENDNDEFMIKRLLKIRRFQTR